jgi:hypothetical protein
VSFWAGRGADFLPLSGSPLVHFWSFLRSWSMALSDSTYHLSGRWGCSPRVAVEGATHNRSHALIRTMGSWVHVRGKPYEPLPQMLQNPASTGSITPVM